jgi:hypothetical protein
VRNKAVITTFFLSSSALTTLSGCTATTADNSVRQYMGEFPSALVELFTEEHSDFIVSEIFIQETSLGSRNYGVEGITEDELEEMEIVYSFDGKVQSQESSRRLEELPKDILKVFKQSFPATKPSQIDIVTLSSSQNEIYEIQLVYSGRQLELNIDQHGSVLQQEEVVSREELPLAVSQATFVEASGMLDVEFEEVTAPDNSRHYVVEYENDEGESISYMVTSGGVIVRKDFEVPIKLP